MISLHHENLTECRGFVGFLNFHQQFIKEGNTLEMEEKEQQAFNTLKAKVAEEPMLLFPQMTKPFKMEVDASAIEIGAVLNQKGEDNKLHPVVYYSKSFTTTEQNYDIYDQELLAIVKVLQQWRTYLLGSPHPILIHMDHFNLQYWKEPRKIN